MYCQLPPAPVAVCGALPVGLLERLLRIAEVSQTVLAETGASTAILVGQIVPNSVRE